MHSIPDEMISALGAGSTGTPVSTSSGDNWAQRIINGDPKLAQDQAEEQRQQGEKTTRHTDSSFVRPMGYQWVVEKAEVGWTRIYGGDDMFEAMAVFMEAAKTGAVRIIYRP